MRLHEVLNKYSPRTLDYSSNQALSYITRYCRPWLEATNGRTAYRGMRHFKYADNSPSVLVRQTRSDRKPYDSTEAYHSIYNLLINIAGGTANRSNAIFVTGNPGEAAYFGRVYAVFPVGGFSYTWSPTLTDWYSEVEEGGNIRFIFDLLKPEIAKKIDTMRLYYTGENVMEQRELFDANSYDQRKVREQIAANVELDAAIDDEHEIMVKCNKALYIEKNYYEDNVFQELHKYWKSNIYGTST